MILFSSVASLHLMLFVRAECNR